MGRTVARSEIRSWKESLICVAKALNDEDIPNDCGVAIEYGIPQTSKRIDFILSGANSAQVEQLVIIELKQWETARKTDRDGLVSRHGRMRPCSVISMRQSTARISGCDRARTFTTTSTMASSLTDFTRTTSSWRPCFSRGKRKRQNFANLLNITFDTATSDRCYTESRMDVSGHRRGWLRV